jgi:hypothetical protein
MYTCLSPARALHNSVLAIGAVLLTLAAACSSPTSPAADGNNAAALRSPTSTSAHNACGVYAGSDQC